MKYVIANWKSHKNIEEIESWFSKFVFSKQATKEVIICPPFSSLEQVANKNTSDNFRLGVQDISSFPAGAYTGAVSALNLQGYPVGYALVGHSERRRYFHENHQDVANKVTQCLENKITPIVCVDDEYISAQARAMEKQQLQKCIVAYEDLGAIGTGHNTPLEHVLKINQLIKANFGDIPIIYGGSVNSTNAKMYLDNTDGVLVGTASLDPQDFMAIINSI